MKPKAKAVFILSVLTTVIVSFGIDTRAGEKGKGMGASASSPGQTRPRPRTRIVEPNERYVVLNKKGEKTREYGPGEAISENCVEIKCPNNIKDAGRGKTVRCCRCGQD